MVDVVRCIWGSRFPFLFGHDDAFLVVWWPDFIWQAGQFGCACSLQQQRLLPQWERRWYRTLLPTTGRLARFHLSHSRAAVFECKPYLCLLRLPQWELVTINITWFWQNCTCWGMKSWGTGTFGSRYTVQYGLIPRSIPQILSSNIEQILKKAFSVVVVVVVQLLPLVAVYLSDLPRIAKWKWSKHQQVKLYWLPLNLRDAYYALLQKWCE